MSRPGAAGTSARSTPQRWATSARAGGVGDAAAAGQQARAARRPRPHRARRPGAGTQATRAPVAAASATSAEKRAGDLGQPLAGEDDRTGLRAAPRSPGRPSVPSASARSDCASAPGSVVSTVADSFSAARVANGARSKTGRPRVRTARRSRRKTIGDSSSGSKPASSTAGAAVRSS